MTKVLRLTTSLFEEGSVSSQLMDELLASWRRNGASLTLTERNFHRTPIPHLDGITLGALGKPAAERSEEEQARVDFADELIAELQAADVIVIGLPMYNFSVPSQLKAWIDHIARAGVTFKYSEEGPRGLLRGKRAILVSAMGGKHDRDTDFLRPYLKLLMNFIGIEDLSVVTAEGLNLGPEAREQGIAKARQQIEKLAIEPQLNRSTSEEAA